jgi:hypothetical protein
VNRERAIQAITNVFRAIRKGTSGELFMRPVFLSRLMLCNPDTAQSLSNRELVRWMKAFYGGGKPALLERCGGMRLVLPNYAK